jgi:hypothetical protein
MAKKKKGAWDVECTEIGPNEYEWETTNFQWRWRAGIGINTCVRHKDNENFQPAIFAKTLNEATLFAHGMQMGYSAHERMTK